MSDVLIKALAWVTVLTVVAVLPAAAVSALGLVTFSGGVAVAATSLLVVYTISKVLPAR